MSIFPKLNSNPDLFQLIYSAFLIILIPAALAFNTIYLLKNVQRDTDFELNNKALLVGEVISNFSQEKFSSPDQLKSIFIKLVEGSSEIKAIEILTPKDDNFESFLATSQNTKSFQDPVLNQLAWGSNQVYSKQIFALIPPQKKERVWLVVSPIKNSSDKKIGLLNLYISAASIDQISNRTTKDSLYILAGTMLAVILLLLNHFKFFEVSILYKKLKDLDQAKDDFISVASHELRAPLTAINGFAYLMIRNPVIANNENAKKYLSLINISIGRLQVLVNDMLDVSRIEQNRMKLDLRENNLTELIQTVVSIFGPQAQQKNLKLEYQPLPTPITINCDKDKMLQIITNLISNAIKYTPQGEVTIYHQLKGKLIQTFVKDTGVGIPSASKQMLFSKFQRIYNEKTKDVTGTGLGLWITKQLVEKMGGSIDVESIENQGTQFIITFPLVTVPSLKSAPQLIVGPKV